MKVSPLPRPDELPPVQTRDERRAKRTKSEKQVAAQARQEAELSRL